MENNKQDDAKEKVEVEGSGGWEEINDPIVRHIYQNTAKSVIAGLNVEVEDLDDEDLVELHNELQRI